MLLRPLRFPVAAAAFALALAGPVTAAPGDDLREAQKLYGQGRLQPAMELVDAYLKAQPREPQGRFLRGLLLTEQKKVNEAIQVFTSLTEDFPELPEPYNNLAVLYASLGNYDKAKSALELAIHTHPSYATAHENLGDIYAQLASRAYDRALQLDKNNTSAQVKLSMVKDLFIAPRSSPASRPEPAKLAAAEPAKVESPKVEPPKAEPPKSAPTKPASAKAVPAQPAIATAKPATAKVEAAPPAAGKTEPAAAKTADADRNAVAAAIEAWATSWSTKDVKGYLAAYAPDFETPGGEARGAWEKQRAERIERPKSIEVKVKIQSIKVDGDTAAAVLRQTYRSDTLRSSSTKTLKLAKIGGKWLIKQERVGG